MPRSADRKPRWSIEDILARTDLGRLLDEYTAPAPQSVRGRRWHCPDPRHDDHRPSVTVRTDHRGHERWRCWSGNHRGDAIDLVMLAQGIDQPAALETLAGRAGLTPNRPLPPPIRRRPAPPPSVVPLDPVVVQYAQACERILHSRGGQPVRDWLTNRGIGPDIARANHLGADPGRDQLFRRKGLPYGASIAATLPALDQAGNIRYLQARYLDPGEGADKYDNPSLKLGSNPRISWAIPTGDPRPGVLLVTEGIPDALIAAQAGFTTAAILGSQAPDPTVAARIATRATRDNLQIIAITDTDPAGRAWGERLEDLLGDLGQDPLLIEPLAGNDLNEWAQVDDDWAEHLNVEVIAPGHRQSSPGAEITADRIPTIDVQ